MEFTENLRRIMNEKNVKQADICNKSTIQSSLMSDYYKSCEKVVKKYIDV
jgi:predicted transcriptional regulator